MRDAGNRQRAGRGSLTSGRRCRSGDHAPQYAEYTECQQRVDPPGRGERESHDRPHYQHDDADGERERLDQ